MERRVENENIALFTSKPEKTLNMKIKYGHKQRGYEEKTELEKMPPGMVTMSHPKTTNNTQRQLKAPEITVDGDEQKTQVPGEDSSMEKRGKYGETQQKREKIATRHDCGG